jgi:hypothetical protein
MINFLQPESYVAIFTENTRLGSDHTNYPKSLGIIA